MKMKAGDETLAIRKKRAQVVANELARLYPNELETPLNYTTPFELLVAVILSAQTTDKQVNVVSPALFEKFPTPAILADAHVEDIEAVIRPLGFYRAKAKNIKAAAAILAKRYDGKVPTTFEELLSLPGVGRKTAHVVLGHTVRSVSGIAVDTHVKRLAKKFGLTGSSNPDVIERELMEILPKRLWWDVSYRLKAYGREVSPARTREDDPILVRLKEKKLL